MRMGWIQALGAMGVGCVISCVGAWAMPLKGEVVAVEKEWRSMRATVENRGHSVRLIQQGCAGIPLKSLEWR